MRIGVVITNGVRSPAEWAEMAAGKIIAVSDGAPQPIRDQAHAFRANLVRVIENYITMAVKENDANWQARLK